MASQRKRFKFCGFSLLAIAGLAIYIRVSTAAKTATLESQISQLASWLKATHPASGEYKAISLPAQFKSLSPTGRVEQFTNDNGRAGLFLKSSLGVKGNYRGYVYAEPGFFISHGHDEEGRIYLGLARDPDPYLTVEKELTNTLWVVYSDRG